MSYPWVDKYSRYGIEPEDYDDDSEPGWERPEDEESPFPDDNGEEYDIPASEDEA